MAPITKISQAKDAAISWTGLSTIRSLRFQQGTARPGLEFSAFVTKAKFVLNNSTLLGMVTLPAKNPPKQCPPQMWVQNGHPWSNIYLFMHSWKISYGAPLMCSSLRTNISHALSKLAWKRDVKFISPTRCGKCYGQGSTGWTSKTQERCTARG